MCPCFSSSVFTLQAQHHGVNVGFMHSICSRMTTQSKEYAYTVITASLHAERLVSICRPKGIEDSGRVEVLSGNMFDQEGLQDTWSPFTKPLQDAGLPRRTFRAPLLAKLNAAGFSNVLDVRPTLPLVSGSVHFFDRCSHRS